MFCIKILILKNAQKSKRKQLESTNGVEQQNIFIGQWITEIIEKISNIPDDIIHCHSGDYTTLVSAFILVGIDKELSFYWSDGWLSK